MKPLETKKLAELLTEVDRLCAEAAKIREKLSQMAGRPAEWPERRQDSRLFLEPSEAHDLATPPSSERNN